MSWQRLADFHDRLSKASAYVAAGLVAIITVLNCVDVFARYFFNAPLTGVAGISGWLLNVTIFLAIPEITREGLHVSILFLQEYLGPQVRPVYLKTVAVISGVACLLIAYVCGAEVWRQFSEGLLTNAEIIVPQWWFTIFIPYGFASAGLHFIRTPYQKDAAYV